MNGDTQDEEDTVPLPASQLSSERTEVQYTKLPRSAIRLMNSPSQRAPSSDVEEPPPSSFATDGMLEVSPYRVAAACFR